MKCQNCYTPAKMFMKDEKNGYSETFWTAPDNRLVCADCYYRIVGKKPKSLQSLNKERKS